MTNTIKLLEKLMWPRNECKRTGAGQAGRPWTAEMEGATSGLRVAHLAGLTKFSHYHFAIFQENEAVVSILIISGTPCLAHRLASLTDIHGINLIHSTDL
ncbi:hypothetical protein Hamer_G011857 [Homarus americanus]|uniref:Uncharacterized protein n=1 Tax=Homarus americanus TaxID=6706 RepID=A0A8J5JY09_HOMAM|nr:hypothetical protein Hamer_G011857 [Homarus americanus]